METDSADVIRSPGTPVDRGRPEVTPSAAESARSVTEAVIRDTATGKITGTVKIMTDFFPASVAVAAAPDERSFILGTEEMAPKGSRAPGSEEYRFFRLPISAGGKPGHLTELPAYPVPMNAFITGIALPLDGGTTAR